MASSATDSKDLGHGGMMYITIDLTGQGLASNVSYVHVKGELKNTNNGAVHGNNNVRASLYGSDFRENTFDADWSANERKVIISHDFSIYHGSDGDLIVDFSFDYGDTGTTTFGGDRNIEVHLPVPHISQPPTKPGTPSVTAITATTLALTWTAPTDHDDTAIKDYILRQYNGSAATGVFIENSGVGRTRNITGLIPGATYTFTVVAYNSSKINGGASEVSSKRTVTMQPGPNVRAAGLWAKSTLYVRSGGEWLQGIPFVRSGGVWKQAK
jgi:hypothetical protein